MPLQSHFSIDEEYEAYEDDLQYEEDCYWRDVNDYSSPEEDDGVLDADYHCDEDDVRSDREEMDASLWGGLPDELIVPIIQNTATALLIAAEARTPSDLTGSRNRMEEVFELATVSRAALSYVVTASQEHLASLTARFTECEQEAEPYLERARVALPTHTWTLRHLVLGGQPEVRRLGDRSRPLYDRHRTLAWNVRLVIRVQQSLVALKAQMDQSQLRLDRRWEEDRREMLQSETLDVARPNDEDIKNGDHKVVHKRAASAQQP